MAECFICGGGGSGEFMTPVFKYGSTPPDNKNILWIDSTPKTGGIKFFNEITNAWEHAPVAYT